MTSITLNVTGAKVQATVNGPLTSGMVGIPVTIRYDNVWNGLIKNLVCRCGQWGPQKGETRTVLSVSETATVAHEVMKADMHLYLGLEGYSADRELVIPTTWADCGKIQHGADGGADPSTTPTLPVWAQLQDQIGQIKQESITEEAIAAVVAAYLEENPIGGSDSSQNVALTTAQINALDGLFKIAAYTEDARAAYAAFQSAFGLSGGEEPDDPDVPVIPDEPDKPEKTLTGISATYSGGDVAVGTAVSDLTGIVVTAFYSNGSTETVTDYTLSGTIVEGSNTVTVSYGGKTTTFAVSGVAESGGGDAVNLYSGKYLKSANIEQHFENGNVFTYTPTQNGSSITYTIEGLEADKDYTIFIESDREDSGDKYSQASVNTGSAASYDGKLISFYPAWTSGGKNYGTFTANGKTMYLWLMEIGANVGGTTPTLTVYIYEGTLTERP